jgi:hypothetical protein
VIYYIGNIFKKLVKRVSFNRELDCRQWLVTAFTIFKLFFSGFRGGEVPRLGCVFNIFYDLPPTPNVQIYSRNFFLNYYIFILFCFISLALTKLHFLRGFQLIGMFCDILYIRGNAIALPIVKAIRLQCFIIFFFSQRHFTWTGSS